MANSTKSAIGVDNRVSSCGKGHFSCFEDNNSQASCSTFTNGFFLGVATVVTTITGPSPMPVTTSSKTGATSAAVSTAAYPCPDLDGTSYTDATGNSYKIQCSTNDPGNDLPAVHADTFEECLRVCDAYVPEPSAASEASCIGVSWGQEVRVAIAIPSTKSPPLTLMMAVFRAGTTSTIRCQNQL